MLLHSPNSSFTEEFPAFTQLVGLTSQQDSHHHFSHLALHSLEGYQAFAQPGLLIQPFPAMVIHTLIFTNPLLLLLPLLVRNRTYRVSTTFLWACLVLYHPSLPFQPVIGFFKGSAVSMQAFVHPSEQD
jgi:hypothetical protein